MAYQTCYACRGAGGEMVSAGTYPRNYTSWALCLRCGGAGQVYMDDPYSPPVQPDVSVGPAPLPRPRVPHKWTRANTICSLLGFVFVLYLFHQNDPDVPMGDQLWMSIFLGISIGYFYSAVFLVGFVCLCIYLAARFGTHQ